MARASRIFRGLTMFTKCRGPVSADRFLGNRRRLGRPPTERGRISKRAWILGITCMLAVSKICGACSVPLPRVENNSIERRDSIKFSREDFAFLGEIVKPIDEATRNGYVVLVTESWTAKQEVGQHLEVTFMDINMQTCVVEKPSLSIRPVLRPGTKVRVVSSSLAILSYLFGNEFLVE